MAAQLVDVSIDRTSPVPLYHQLSEQLCAAITDGRLQPGDPFEVTGNGSKGKPDIGNGYGEWNLSRAEWQAKSALKG